MAKGRRRNNLQWYSFTDDFPVESINESVSLFNVSDVSGGISGFGATIPSGTMERMFVRVSVALQSLPTNSFYIHVIGGVRHDEMIQQGGTFILPSMDLAESEAAGYEDILMMDSVILWRTLYAGSDDDNRSPAKMMALHTKSKRRLEESDSIALDIGQIPHAGVGAAGLSVAVDARILVKQG